MKLFLALLTNHKIDKLKRLVKSVQLQYHENTIQVEPIIVVNTLNDDYYEEVKEANFPFKVIRTESNGKPGKGKNSCYELFHQSDCDFISIIDGDDFLYPTFLRSLANHINHYPDLDVLCRIPLDYVTKHEANAGHRFKVGEYHGSVWGTSLFPVSREYQPKKGEWVDTQFPIFNLRFIAQSKAGSIERMHEDIGNGEDHLYGIQLLKQHIDGKIRFYRSASSDFLVVDRTLDDNIQVRFPQQHEYPEMKKRMLNYVHPNRSSFDELPCIFKNLELNQFEKEEYIVKIF